MDKLPAYEEATRILSKRAKAGQLFMPAAFINDSQAHINSLEQLIRTHHIGGICFFHSRASAAANFEGKQEVTYHPDSLKRLKELIQRYQEAAPYPLLMAMDAEWGLAMRVEQAPQYPYAATLGALKEASEALVYEVGLSMARDCREAGIHWNFAPVVDINTNPDNPVIGFRAFGNRPDGVLRKARQLLQGLADGGVLSCLKHFPGHGDTAVDSHLDLPVLQKSLDALEKSELMPFRELIREGAPAVMTGHLAVPGLDPSGLPASLSKTTIDLLRESMGFQGVLVTDALNMHALHSIDRNPVHLNLKACEAGNDVLCFASDIPESLDLILSKIESERLEASFRRIWKLKERVFKVKTPPREPRWSCQQLNQKLAPLCLAEIGEPGQALEAFRKDAFSILYFGKRPEAFLEALETGSDKAVEWTSELQIPTSQKVLFALNPPSMKPAEHFGLPASFQDALVALAAKNHVVLYLFGNPYLLRLLPTDRFYALVCAFQPLPSFQEAAAGHFLGKIRAEGELSIDLDHG